MKKKELYEYIDSLNTQNYTDDQLLEIGLKHKALEQKEKNWSELVEYLNLEKSGETFRKWIARKASDLKVEVEVAETSKTDDEYAEKMRNLYIAKQQNRDVMNSYRKNIRDEARIETLKDLIAEAVAKLPALPPVTKLAKLDVLPNRQRVAVLMLSDLHIGVNCDNFYNTYNVDVAAYRLSKLATDVLDYCKAMNVGELDVCNLGDMIHGLIHINARLEQQMDTVEQVMTAAELIGQFLHRLEGSNLKIVYRSCTDNHSRMVADKNQHVEKDNLYRIIDWYLEERLKDSEIIFKHDNLDAGIGMFKVFDRNIVFVHGHEDSVDKMMQNMVGATGQIIDYALMGHFHCEKMKSYQGFKVFINGSIVGTEQYALSRRLFSRPSQTLLVFQQYDRNVIDINIDLGE